MKPSMTKGQARVWMDRWRLMNEAVIEETRAQSPDEKLRDLDLLFASRHLFRWPDDEVELEEVRRRWARLKELARGQ